MYQKFVKIYGNKVVFYQGSIDYIGKRESNGSNLEIDRKKAYKGEVSDKSIKRTKENLAAWLMIMKVGYECYKKKICYPVLITLTLSSKQEKNYEISDKEIKKNMLEPMLKRMKYKYNIVNYWWRAESQKNGNIHFHIITDKFIKKEEIQHDWNEIQEKNGYLKEYILKYKHNQPPSTHIRKFELNDKEINYLIGYVTKKSNNRKINGLQSRSSNKLSKLLVISQELSDSEYCKMIVELEKKAKNTYTNEHCIIYYFQEQEHYKILNEINFEINENYYKMMFNALYINALDVKIIELVNKYYTNRHLYNYYKQIFKNDKKLDLGELKFLENILERH